MEEEIDEFDKEIIFGGQEPKKGGRPTKKLVSQEPKQTLEAESEIVLQEKETALLQQVFQKMDLMEQAYTKILQDVDLTKRRISETLEKQKDIESRIFLVREEQLDKFSNAMNQVGERLEEANKAYREIRNIFVDFEEKKDELRKDYAMGPRRNSYDYCVDTIFKLEKNFAEMMPALRELQDKMASLIDVVRKEREIKEEK